MAEDKNSELEEKKSLSLFDEKMKHLLDEIDERMDQIGGDFGPILMQELQNRLENIVKNFNNEVNEVFSESFKKWKLTDTQLREFAKSDIKLSNKQIELNKEAVDNESTPAFIKDVKFGPVRSK